MFKHAPNLTLADSTGAPLSASAIPFEVLPTDIEVTGAPPSPITRMFPPPDAKIVHVYATALASAAGQTGEQVTRYSVLLSLLVVLPPEGRSQIQTCIAGSDGCLMELVSAASFASGLPYGGALATAYVSGLPGLTAGTYIAPSSQPLPNSLGGVQVLVNGAVAPVVAVVVPSDPSAYVQVNFQVPLERNVSLFAAFSAGSSLAVEGGGVAVTAQAPQAPLPVPPRWGAFFASASGLAAALHGSDSTPVTPQHPAHPGETIIAYADDFFSTWPPPPIGIPVDQPAFFQPTQRPTGQVMSGPGYLYLQTYPVSAACPPSLNQGSLCTVSATNTPALKVTFEGLAAGKIGVEEIDFVVPANQQPGSWALFFNDGSCPDGSGVPGTCGATSGSSSPYVLLPVD